MNIKITEELFEYLLEVEPCKVGEALQALIRLESEGSESEPINETSRLLYKMLSSSHQKEKAKILKRKEGARRRKLLQEIKKIDKSFNGEGMSVEELEEKLDELRNNKEKGNVGEKSDKVKSESTEEKMVKEWNKVAEEFGLPKVSRLTPERRQKIKTRIKNDKDFYNLFIDALGKIKSYPFLRGEGEQGWRVNFDWIIRNDSNVRKVIEGNYEGLVKKEKSVVDSEWIDKNIGRIGFGFNVTKRARVIEAEVVNHDTTKGGENGGVGFSTKAN